MSPTSENLSQATYNSGKALDEATILKEFHIRWDVRPHRFSKIVVKTGQNKKNELKQHEPVGLFDHESLAYVEGGTWGNGGVAADKAMGFACTAPLTGKKFFKVSSDTFALKQNSANFPLNIRHYRKEKSYVEGYHKLEIEFDHEIDARNIAVAVDGFNLSSGPNHKAIGITTNGIKFSVVNETINLENGITLFAPRVNPLNKKTLTVYVFAKQSYGSELTRTASGLFRQSLNTYSAKAQIDLIIIKDKEFIKKKLTKVVKTDIKKFRLGLPGKIIPSVDMDTSCKSDTSKRDLTKVNAALLSSIEMSFHKKNGDRASRYFRSVNFSFDIKANNLVQEFKADNIGEVSWRTMFKFQTEYLILLP